MGKPQETYLRGNRRAQIVNQAKQAKTNQAEVANQKHIELERLLKRMDLRNAKRIAKICKNFGDEPEDEQDRLKLKFIKILKDLNKFAKEQSRLKGLSSELGTASSRFVAKTKTAKLDAASITQSAMAAIVFILIIEKAASKFRRGR